MKQGVEPAFAREQALQRFGDIESAKRQLYASARQREDRLRWRTAVDDVRRDGFEADPRPELFVLYRQVPMWTTSMTAVVRAGSGA